METHNNLLLLRVMKEHGHPLWYATEYPLWNSTDSTATYLPLWTGISQKTRKKSKSFYLTFLFNQIVSLLNDFNLFHTGVWCQETWFSLRKQYLEDRRAELTSQIATEFLQKYREHLVFLEINAEQWAQVQSLLEPSITTHPAKNDEDNHKTELKSSVTTNDSVGSVNVLQKSIQNDSKSPQDLSLPSSSEIDTGKVAPLDDNQTMCVPTSSNIISKAGSKRRRSELWETLVLKKPSNNCEDTAFGEWVTARLLKLNPNENQQAKQEIIDILL